MIPRSQHFRDRAPFPFLRSGVLRIFDEPVLVGLLDSAIGRAHYSGKQANASVETGERGGLSARQDDIGKAYLLDLRIGLENAFVEAFEPPAQYGNAGPRCDVADARLRDRLAARGHGQDRSPLSHAGNGRAQHVGLEHHARPAAGGRIVDRTMLVGREIADLYGFAGPVSALERTPRKADASYPT